MFKENTLKQVSLLVAILAAAAYLMGEWGGIWGFSALADQISATLTSVIQASALVFGGSTLKDYINKKKETDGNEKASK